ncbi:succinate dehydrogenase, cytochrome b556 subunit [Kiloniella laminariae]|uniref:Succinate dehydrogenase cytochrome b556 subunit n=1 Tax=Kiloniella laminariae TaxID=454162 RepID=A0ABT4LMX7_9PROT|nr:succinate dehydrogenase, cytochrome b556 subunit [Kiloniella laminariae]MCZ4282426.1 succinate dehydrogenase, cytochrome b556 subunit [Kiloniella laminariae]
MTRGNRPLSPHLQVYRPQLTSSLSILFRIMGVATSVGSLVLIWWLVAAASGAEYFEMVQSFLGSWFGRLMLFGWTLALVYHLCNGVRHLYWDAGKGMDLPSVHASGKAVVVVSLLLTLGLWVLAYSVGGA